ncbi:MAG: glycosyltransferase family 4 protein [Alphaproteobacteria bacterium]|nr:glycosyltransferase family 4 protein [Alphaproteobacteria bacterium]
MARILMADDGIAFDGTTPEKGPLGGAESSFVNLAETLAQRGHSVEVRNKCERDIDHKGVAWRRIDQPWPETADLYVANRGDKMILRMPGARKTIFWTHNPATYMMKWRYLWKMAVKRPDIVFIGTYHATTYPAWAPGGKRVVIPYGIPEMFRSAEPGREVPPPRAVFTSNPLRSLDWLLDLWANRIQPKVPTAELHVFSGAATYGSVGDSKADAMQKVLARAQSLKEKGVVLRGPVPKAQLVDEFRTARCLLYKGDINETFCLAVGEAQAMGVPAVVQPIGSVVERVVDGRTGHIAASDEAFADAAVKLLADEAHWRTLHDGALALQRRWGWQDAAQAFESLLP